MEGTIVGGLVDAVKAGAEPLSKLIDVASRGIGTLYEPTKIRKLAKAKAFEMSTIAQAIRDNPDLPMFYDRDGVKIDSSDVKALAERASNRLLLQEMKKQQNIETIVDKAYENLEGETVVSSEPVDDDWIARFFNSVEDISTEKLRELWGRLLAGEIKAPKSFSLRTLEVLRNLSSADANLIEKIAPLALWQNLYKFIPNEDKLYEKHDFTYEELLKLDNAGIICLTPLNVTLQMNKAPRVINNRFIIGVFDMMEGFENAEISLPIYCFTPVGSEILSLFDVDQKASEEYTVSYFSTIKSRVNNCKVSAYKIIGFSNGLIHHETDSLI